jgi:hypothetical protein
MGVYNFELVEREEYVLFLSGDCGQIHSSVEMSVAGEEVICKFLKDQFV